MHNADHLRYAPLAELVKSLQDNEVSVREVIDAVFDAIAANDLAYSSFVNLNRYSAYQQAALIEKRVSAGAMLPLFGVPIAIKDNVERLGEPVSAGLGKPLVQEAQHDAIVVQKLRNAGAIIIGATRMDALAYSATGETAAGGPIRNPFGSNRMSGGSSGGSAVAVASGVATIGIGTDTGGSVRIPASLCGVSGLKPTFGALSCEGVWPLAPSLDHVGLLGRSADDISVAFNVLMEPLHRNRPPVPLAKLRIGFLSQALTNASSPDVLRRILDAAGVFKSLGMQVTDMCIEEIEAAPRLENTIVMFEVNTEYRRLIDTQPDFFEPGLKDKLQAGERVSVSEYAEAQRQQKAMMAAVDRAFESIDILLLPTTPLTAPPVGGPPIQLGGRTRDAGSWLLRCTTPFNLTGHPAISIPCGFDSEGLPVGMQLVGRRYHDESVLRVASMYQQATQWHRIVLPQSMHQEKDAACPL